MELLGPIEVKTHLVSFLRARLPAYLDVYRTRRGLVEEDLPTPHSDLFLRNPPQSLDTLPCVAVEVRRKTRVQRIEPTDDQTHRATYVVVVYAWVKAETWQATYDQRDGLTSATSYLLLDRPHLDLQPLGDMLVNEDTLSEDYTDVTPVRGDRWVAGGTINFNLLVYESVTRPRIGTISEIALQVDSLHPSFE